MNLYLRDSEGRDDTLDPAYLTNRLKAQRGAGGTVDDETLQQLNQSINSLATRTSTLETKVYQQGNKISSIEEKERQFEESQAEQDARLDALEESQAAQDERLDTAEQDIEDIKESLNHIGTTTTIVNYVSSVIGLEVPDSVKDDPETLAQWLAEQDDEEGIDLASLAKRIRDIEENVMTDEDIEDLVNGGH